MKKKKNAPKPEEVRARIKELVQQTLQEALRQSLRSILGIQGIKGVITTAPAMVTHL